MAGTDFGNDTAAFRQFAKRRLKATALDVAGGRNDVGLFQDSLNSALAHLTLRPTSVDPSGEMLTFAAGYLEKPVPNALADLEDGRHYLAMNTALFVAIQEFAMFCFTQADFFPDVGDPSFEVSPRPLDDRVPGLWLLDFTTKQGGRVGEEHGEKITPKGESRYVASIYLGLLMARYVWLHEYLHCFNGHVRYAQATGRATRLYEIDEDALAILGPPEERERDEVLHCLELDADQSAFWASCQMQLHGRENIEGIAALDLSLRLRLTLFGAYAITWLFEEFQNYLDAKAGITHPHPYLRLQNLVRTGLFHLEKEHADFATLSKYACDQFDIMQRAIPSMYGTQRVVSGAQDPDVQSELDRLHALLHKVRDELVPYRYSDQP